MATSPVDAAEFGFLASVNRQCCRVLFRCSDYPGLELVQASGTPVRFQYAGRVVYAIKLPARVLKMRQQIREVVIIGAAADMSPRVIWRMTLPLEQYDFGSLVEGIHFVICPDYKPHTLHRKENDWGALIVDQTWASKQVTLQNNSKASYALGGRHGFFNFPSVYPASPLAALAPVPNSCDILGFEECSLPGVGFFGPSFSERFWQEWRLLINGTPGAFLLGRGLRVFAATTANSWDNAVAMVDGVGEDGARVLPLKERQFSPEPASMRMWPTRIMQGLRKAARGATLEPLRGAGCKPAYQDRQQVAVGIDLLVAGIGERPGVRNEPGKGWEGGPWLDVRPGVPPTLLGMHIGTTLKRPHLYFGRCMRGQWLTDAARLLDAANLRIAANPNLALAART